MKPFHIADGERITALFSHPNGGSKSDAESTYDLLPSFQRALRAEGKSPSTVASYTESVRYFYDYARATDMPTGIGDVRREHVGRSFVHQSGHEPSIPYGKIMSLLKRTGYSGTISAEWEGQAFTEEPVGFQEVRAWHTMCRRLLAD